MRTDSGIVDYINIYQSMFYSPEYSTNMANIGLWLGVCFTISSHEYSTDVAMGLDMCDSNITGFQSVIASEKSSLRKNEDCT